MEVKNPDRQKILDKLKNSLQSPKNQNNNNNNLNLNNMS